MRVAVVGAGVIGITTAHELALAGHQVTVFDSHTTPAEETSFAPGGLCSPAYVHALAWGSTPARFKRDIWSANSPLLRLGGRSMTERLWLWRWLRAGQQPSDTDNRQALLGLALLSHERLKHWTTELALEHEQTAGLNIFLRTEAEKDEAQKLQATLTATGLPHQWLDETACRKLENALNPDTPLAAALHLPGEHAGNCRQFSLLMKKACETLEVAFEMDCTVEPLRRDSATTLQVRYSDGHTHTMPFDAVVLCAGQSGAALLQALHPELPCMLVHGYSLSAQIREPLNAPRHNAMDWQHRVHITRLGQRVRVSGLAQTGGHATGKHAGALKRLYKVLLDWYPGACHMQQVQEWRGTRLCMPDGLPVVGASAVPGVWLNIAHGDTGWATACGAAAGLAGLMTGRPVSGVEWSRLGLDRLGTRP
jgi:D-amino-acid dehydrogenase